MARVLYITYTGLLQPLGQSQVLNYLLPIAQQHEVTVLSYERSDDLRDTSQADALATKLQSAGIGWRRLSYTKRPPGLSTLWDITKGLTLALWIALRQRVQIVHCRSYVPSVIGLILKKLLGPKFLFDMRGFWADERVDVKSWRAGGLLYRTAKWFERKFLQNADAVVSLTHAGVREIEKFDYLQDSKPDFWIIPTCTDLDRFRPLDAAPSNGQLTIGYIGTASLWCRFDRTAQAFKFLLDQYPEARFLIVNRKDHRLIRELLAEANVPDDKVELLSANYEEMPELISRMDAGIFFIKPAYSKLASAPTRLGEFLACGKPCLVNAGVGDTAEIVASRNVGVCVEEYDDERLKSGVASLLQRVKEPDIAERCRQVATERFSLERGVQDYLQIYATLLQPQTGRA